MCPYLGLREDRATHADFPSVANRCWRAGHGTVVAPEHQRNYCLTPACTRCPQFRDPALIALARGSVAGNPAGGARGKLAHRAWPWDGLIRGTTERRGLWLVLVAGLIVALVLLLALTGRQRPARTAPGAPAAEAGVIADGLPVSLATSLSVGAESAAMAALAVRQATATLTVAMTVPARPTIAVTGPGAGAHAAPAMADGRLLTDAPSAAELLRRIAQLEAGLRSGEFQITIDDGNARSALVTVRFDRGGGDRARRVQVVSVADGPGGREVREQIAVGGRVWERRPGGTWAVATSQDGLWAQVEAYLPRAAAIADPVLARAPGVMILRYADTGRDAETVLTYDLASGLPRELHQVSRGGGGVRVLYRGWNTPVDIREPQAQGISRRLPSPAHEGTLRVGGRPSVTWHG
jgi:hypothetical protein